MSASLKLDGLADLNKRLKKLGGKVANKVSRDAVREGAKVVRKEMRAGAPKGETGNLRKSIRYRIRGRKGNFRARIGVTSKIYYAWFLEYGTAAHTVPGKSKGGNRSNAKVLIDGKVFSKANHPGIRPNPFMRRAWDRSQRRTEQAIKSTLWKRIREESNRL